VTDEIVWKEPPLRRFGNNKVWVERLTPLLAHPDRWAMVSEAGSAATATNLRNGTYKVPAGNWEFRSHQVALGKYEVYARYLGPKEGES
jgi:hypothetical protein